MSWYGTSYLLTIRRVKLWGWERYRRGVGTRIHNSESGSLSPSFCKWKCSIYPVCPEVSVSSICFSLHCPEGPRGCIQSNRPEDIYDALQLTWELLHSPPSEQSLLSPPVDKLKEVPVVERKLRKEGREDWEKVVAGEPHPPQTSVLLLCLLAVVMVVLSIIQVFVLLLAHRSFQK